MYIKGQLPAHKLPDSVQDLVDLIGLTAALAIVEERGGIRLYVPTRVSRDHWLAKTIGPRAFGTLVDVYAGEEIDVPRCVDALRAVRELAIINDARAGLSQAQLARKYGYTERGIRKLMQRVGARDEPEQIGLFE